MGCAPCGALTSRHHGATALTFGPWAQPAPTIERGLLMAGFLIFSMIGTVATNVVGVLESQADEIAALRQRLGAGVGGLNRTEA
jgi:hypothetical protein